MALGALYREVGFARSLLAYELPDGRLKLIDGHLRKDLDPDMEVDVEILDVDDAEARALLLSIDPLASLAETQRELQRRLIELTPTPSPDLHCAWKGALEHAAKQPPEKAVAGIPEQYLVVMSARTKRSSRRCCGGLSTRGSRASRCRRGRGTRRLAERVGGRASQAPNDFGCGSWRARYYTESSSRNILGCLALSHRCLSAILRQAGRAR